MKKVYLFILSVSLGLLSVAQQNVVKLAPFSLIYGKYNLQYERMLTDYTSASVSISFLKPNIPNSDFVAGMLEMIGLESNMDGFSVELDYRFYSQNKPGPRGFYIGPYFRHTSLNAIAEPISASDFKVGIMGSRTGAGVKLGAQWVLFDKMTIDWTFLGLGVDYYGAKVFGEVVSDGELVQDEYKTGGFMTGFNSGFTIGYTF
jgi:hypothetical protein